MKEGEQEKREKKVKNEKSILNQKIRKEIKTNIM